ncbi:acyl-CoA N-acyltransferase [Calocera viscosa TUFC12733]|uniref:Acyl-CoA N-acyltransferase n=1 Tax=Calocera viscosa (strain TUFC12733) TaxID=1330018 RepID=A0A167GK73_CALVF|nr:acyl-CoA N-acyltransferase [Calocera viscosa TUFC12733]
MSGLPPFNIKTSRTVIRRFMLGEVDFFMRCRNDPAYLHDIPWLSSLTPFEAWSIIIKQALVHPGAPYVDAQLAIVDKRTSAFLGICSLAVDGTGLRGEIGINISREYHGCGYGQEVIRALVFWACESEDGPMLHAVTATVEENDTGSLAAYAAAGFRMTSRGKATGRYSFIRLVAEGTQRR